jgi:hypothetical protein
MKSPARRLYAAAIALCLFAGGQARADLINWSYNWTPSATQINADVPSTGNITLSPSAGGTTTGDSFIVATNIQTVSNASPSNPATFTNALYSLTLTITDGDSNTSGNLTFNGQFNGILSNKSAIIMNDFLGQTTQSVTIGNHLYTVKIGPFAPPGPPTAQNPGSISALASVTVSDAPEPSTLVLSGMCMSLFGAGWWLRRGRSRAAALNMA